MFFVKIEGALPGEGGVFLVIAGAGRIGKGVIGLVPVHGHIGFARFFICASKVSTMGLLIHLSFVAKWPSTGPLRFARLSADFFTLP